MNNDKRGGSRQEGMGNQAARAAGGANGMDVPTESSARTSPMTGSGVEWRTKTVLLVDSNGHSRGERAAVMRRMGLDVDCAGSASAARALLAAQKFNLVLVDLGPDSEGAESFVAGLRTSNPRQLVQFLVGSPRFLAPSLNGGASRARQWPTAPVAGGPIEKPTTPAVTATSFGLKVRDIELEQAADEAGTH